MDSNSPPPVTPPPPPPPPPPRSYSSTVSSPGVFGTRIPGSVSFIVGLLLFFLPFAQLKCNGSVLAQNSGFGLAIGSQWKTTMANTGLFGDNDMGESKAMNKKQDPNLYAIVAMALAALGLVLSFANGRATGYAGLVTGLLSAAALIGMMIDLKNDPQLKNAVSKPKTGNAGFDSFGDVQVGLEFTPWFYIAIIAFLAAAFFSYRRAAAVK